MKQGRPNKSESIAIQKRDAEIFTMSEKYPVEYIASYYNLTPGRVVQILNRKKKEKTGSAETNEVATGSIKS